MSGTDPRVEAFYAEAERWREELAALRAILTATELEECWKWRSPCYTFQGGNVATVWGFRDACTLGFFKGVLLNDPEGLLEAPGENSRSSRVLKFTSLAEIEAGRARIEDFVAQSIGNEKAGRKVEMPPDDFDLPEELAERLEADPELGAAWDGLTPGRRRGWVLHVGQAKQSATRQTRIDKAAPKILAGKGMHDR